jgi:stage II sporulation protein R
MDYNLNYGDNYFPEKSYKGVKYPSGTYESLVVTLGSGKGENWWCVLYPPLCMMDNKESNLNNVEYASFIEELFNKYL